MQLGLGAALATVWAGRALAQDSPQAPAPAIDLQNFDFEALSSAMRAKAGQAYVEQPSQLPQVLLDLTYDEHRMVRFRPDHALWRDQPVSFQLQAFYPGSYFKDTARIFVGDGKVFQEQHFTGADFEYRAPLDPSTFQGIDLPGVAGFRLHYPLQRPDVFDELVTFLGASYFRALGSGTRYGLSARGLAINTATSDSEEFPRFTTFYIVRPKAGDNQIQIYAEMDSPSVTGAFAFTLVPGEQTIVDVTARLYFRAEVQRLGVAPLTSMFFFGEHDHGARDDFRPEVHDSDGLVIYRANGERLWRPVRNPAELALSHLAEVSPRGFGLIQRDRDFSHYEDLEARYDLRPSLMIEPLSDWGSGAIELVEIPSANEANDNIVAFWVPEDKPKAGSSYEFRYRMRWGLEVETFDRLAHVSDTFAGAGGNAVDEPQPNFRRFAINFRGGTVANLPDGVAPEPIVEVSEKARVNHVALDRLPDGGWRLAIELERTESGPVEIRAKLSMMQRIVSETFLYQWTGSV
ncbi:glucan biosynthesis protein [Consotaella salsifontis]|uniref:Glucans biosynthesis protein n=1 Tax=Consotaella salsifontis TaxID=1365950 RepID=A0A1T4QUY4_9HYPH|nr:glucan biosynthesis protein G [Consotaella salsifontis]SKA07397.1 glucans biosynthesis protein [Consotaella salsifontis]